MKLKEINKIKIVNFNTDIFVIKIHICTSNTLHFKSDKFL